jgi:RNA polymerase sigma-70 factor (ECF subfamily)
MTPDAETIGTTADTLETAALADVVRSAIDRLPPEQRQAVELAFIGGLTYREVAEVLGLPEGTVKSRLRLAQSKLHTWLDRQLLEFA